MLKLLSQRKIKEGWKKYKTHIETAMTSSEGGLVVSQGPEDIYKSIFERLMNPFNTSMHLWIDNNDDYLLLTHIQTCEFTGKRTLVLFSLTRTEDVDKETITKRWFDGYQIISEFSKENKCSGILGYTDLEYFIKIAKEVSESTNQKILIRYQYYVPL